MNPHSKNSNSGRDGSTGFFVMAATCLVAGLFTFFLAGRDADTKVDIASLSGLTVGETADYTTKLIEDIEVGDLVVSRDSETAEVTHKRVLQAFRRTSDHLRILEIESADGKTQRIETTDEHPFWVSDRGFVNAGELRAGDQLDDSGNGAVVLTSIREPHPAGIEVCNFEVEDFHTYFVRSGGTRGPPLFVHNSECPSESFESLAQLRRDLGIPAAGAAGDSFTLARLDIDGRTFFGINGGLNGADDAARTLQKLAAELGHKGPTFQLLRHAEGDALLQAFNRGVGKGKKATLVVDNTFVCSGCRSGLDNMRRLLGLEELTVITRSGGPPLAFPRSKR